MIKITKGKKIQLIKIYIRIRIRIKKLLLSSQRSLGSINKLRHLMSSK